MSSSLRALAATILLVGVLLALIWAFRTVSAEIGWKLTLAGILLTNLNTGVERR